MEFNAILRAIEKRYVLEVRGGWMSNAMLSHTVHAKNTSFYPCRFVMDKQSQEMF